MAGMSWPRPLARPLLAASLFLFMLALAGRANADCSDAHAARKIRAETEEPLTAIDLARIRDIGPPSSDNPDQPVFTLAPDLSAIALQVRQGDPGANRICLMMVIVPLAKGRRPHIVDRGGEMIRLNLSILGRAASPSGIAAPITPRWFPNNLSIAFLKRAADSTQIWLAAVNGQKAVQLTHDVDDIDDFRVSADGREIVYVTRPGLREAEQRMKIERLSGFRYDERFSPMAGSEPFVAAPVAGKYFAFDMNTRQVRTANPSDIAFFASSSGLPGRLPGVASAGPLIATIRQSDSKAFPPSTQLAVEDGDHRKILCQSAQCHDVSAPIWWIRRTERVRYMRREGWANSLTSIYEWSPGDANPVLLYRTADNLVECHPSEDRLFCLDEGSTSPRRLVAIDLSSGEKRVIFDPNPEFRRFAVGGVERLQYLNAFGIECFADLVFPVHYQPGVRYPLVVVQYQTRGFLRGGTGDEVPIQVLANRGFAVLSMQNPSPWPLVKGALSADAIDAALMHDFTGRRSVLSSIETAIARLIDRGIVDRSRIGITGLSDGSSTVQFAAVNSNLFRAGSVSGCCWEPDQDAFSGPAIANLYARTGWPRMINRNSEFWSKISISSQPDRVGFPLLFQVSDDEYLMAVGSLTALRQAGKPADMFIYSGEHHLKWQPSHRLAVYQRNIAWFEFWLKGIIPSDGETRQEVLRWRSMTQLSGGSD